MRAYYGANDTYVDVTETVMQHSRGHKLDLTDGNYNSIFQDVAMGMRKKLRIIEDGVKEYDEDERVMHIFSSKKYFLCDLNGGLFAGLTNQLMALVSAIVMSIECGRDLVVKGVYPMYNRPGSVHLGEVIDIDSLNDTLSEYRVKVYDVRDFGYTQWENISWMEYIHNLPVTAESVTSGLERMGKRKETFLNLGYTFEMGVLQTPPDMGITYRKIWSSLPFNKTLTYLSRIEGEYHAIHLRLEDDMLDHLAKIKPGFNEAVYVQGLFSQYMDHIRSKTGKILLCTGLEKFNNRHSYLVNEIRKIREVVLLPSIGRGREIDAAVDMIACMNADSFLGVGGSTFTTMILMGRERRGLPQSNIVNLNV